MNRKGNKTIVAIIRFLKLTHIQLRRIVRWLFYMVFTLQYTTKLQFMFRFAFIFVIFSIFSSYNRIFSIIWNRKRFLFCRYNMIHKMLIQEYLLFSDPPHPVWCVSKRKLHRLQIPLYEMSPLHLMPRMLLARKNFITT